MQGLMQDWPLRTTAILDHAARYHASRPVIWRDLEGGIRQSTWTQVRSRALRLAAALGRLGVGPGDVVGAMAWNSGPHMEVWYGVPGAGAVLHSLNPRLSAGELTYIIGHAEDRWIFVDRDLLPVVAPLAADLPALRGVIVLGPRGPLDDEPAAALPEVLFSEELIEAEPEGAGGWHRGDEGDACGICYTSGTTGRPKGVVYAHRSNVLHAMAMIQPDMLGLSSRDVMMPVVPLFHANGWSCGYSIPMAGATMVMPGRHLDPASLWEMLELGVTVTAAVPTVWLSLLKYLRETGHRLDRLERVVIGGSSCPRAVIEAFQNDYGVRVLHAWGMTETSPLGTICSFKPEVGALPEELQIETQLSVGHPPFTVDLQIADDDGAPLDWDGETQGRLLVRGPGVVGRYLKAEEPAIDGEGWFDTGDAATIDPLGYVRITDRLKDMIKSGGEWISSIELENAALAHPDVFEAAAVAMPHPKWGERPVLVVVPRPGSAPEAEAILGLLRPHFARWQIPDDVIVADEIPHTATGKISKLALRKRLNDQGYTLPDQR